MSEEINWKVIFQLDKEPSEKQIKKALRKLREQGYVINEDIQIKKTPKKKP